MCRRSTAAAQGVLIYMQFTFPLGNTDLWQTNGFKNGLVNNFLFIYFFTFVGVTTCLWQEQQGGVTHRRGQCGERRRRRVTASDFQHHDTLKTQRKVGRHGFFLFVSDLENKFGKRVTATSVQPLRR